MAIGEVASSKAPSHADISVGDMGVAMLPWEKQRSKRKRGPSLREYGFMEAGL